ncbi:hypothetical protein Ppb6_02007 [Photorhabdus australis subsp. thailandensis]|uniref:Uncharacterized protein n=1 Tax=Photorhabdus australis subsp. thailandensis TaxID=2805096 RepID=A0A1C0U407_9GAMM|nr:hypothetical protein Ppb6_02007 [Photorhabdus australis subsp. thailandensis]
MKSYYFWFINKLVIYILKVLMRNLQWGNFGKK